MPASSRLRIARALSFFALLVAPVWAFAHDGLMSSGIAGFLHPVAGIDHVIAMLAVGIWAARLELNERRVALAVFPLGMLGGALASVQGLHLPGMEAVIGASAVGLTLMALTGGKVAAGRGAVVVVLSAIFHGQAHALEAPAQGSLLAYCAGFVFATSLLQAAALVAVPQCRQLSSRQLSSDVAVKPACLAA